MYRFRVKRFIQFIVLFLIGFWLTFFMIGKYLHQRKVEPGIEEIIFIKTPNKARCATKHLLIVIKCRVKEFEERQQIRKTWGKQALNLGMTYIFALGNETVNEAEANTSRLNTEIQTFDDILQSNVPENYHLLTLKAYANLYFLVNDCFNADYLLFVDCDVIVFPSNLAKFIQNRATHNNTIYGFCYDEESPVRRDPKLRPYVPRSVWAPDKYPPFCSGSAYLMASDVAQSLLAVVPGGAENWRWAAKMDLLDDVMFTGYLRELANVNMSVSRENFRVSFLHPYDFSKNLCQQQNEIVSIHGFRPVARYQECWSVFMNSFKVCLTNSSYLSNSHCYKTNYD